MYSIVPVEGKHKSFKFLRVLLMHRPQAKKILDPDYFEFFIT